MEEIPEKKAGRPKGRKNKNQEPPEPVPKGITVEDHFSIPALRFPSTTLIIAKKFSGKTNLILNIVNPKDFDNIFIVSATGHTGNFNSIADSDHILDGISEEFIEILLKFHVEKTDAKTMIIFDDFIGLDFDPKKSQKMRLLASSGRNFNISIVFSSQDLVSIPPLIRRNSEYLFIGNNTSNVIEKLSTDLAFPSLGKQKMIDSLVKISKAKDFEFLFLDDREQEFKIVKPKRVV